MESISNNISTLVIKKGQGVLDAIVAIAKKNGISYTRKELYTLGGEICARLDRDKLRQDCVVQPGQEISTQQSPGVELGKIEKIAGYEGLDRFIKHTDPHGVVTYYLNGQILPKTQQKL